MSGKPSTSRERIIPIQIEGEDSSFEENKNDEDVSEDIIDSIPDPCCDEALNSYPEIPIKRCLPMCNAKEKIILVVDSAEDENFTPFKVNNGQQNKPLDMLKHAVEMFLHSKQLINKKHEYALAVLNENGVIWQVDFTNNINEIVKALQGVNSCETEDIFGLNSLFDVILQHVEVPELCVMEGTTFPPPYVVHTILLYGRSYTVPELLETDEIQELLQSPFFTMDVLMTHEPVDDDNNCNRIFSVLQNLDKKGFAYFFPVARDSKTLLSSVGKLLAHPLQRPVQKLANYSIKKQ